MLFWPFSEFFGGFPARLDDLPVPINDLLAWLGDLPVWLDELSLSLIHISHGPSLYHLLEVLGKEKSLVRIEKAIGYAGFIC